MPAPHLLLGILGEWWQTGFAGPAAVVGRGSCLLQLAPVRVEEPHSFGAPHVVPAGVREGGKSDREDSSWALQQYLSLSVHASPGSATDY